MSSITKISIKENDSGPRVTLKLQCLEEENECLVDFPRSLPLKLVMIELQNYYKKYILDPERTNEIFTFTIPFNTYPKLKPSQNDLERLNILDKLEKKKLPLYINSQSEFFPEGINDYTECNDEDLNFPILVVNIKDKNNFIKLKKFIINDTKYKKIIKDTNSTFILDKVLRLRNELYKEKKDYRIHHPSAIDNYNLICEINDAIKCKIYSENDKKKIIEYIKKDALKNKDNINNNFNFNDYIDNLTKTLMDIIINYLLFDQGKKLLYFICKICNSPYIIIPSNNYYLDKIKRFTNRLENKKQDKNDFFNISNYETNKDELISNMYFSNSLLIFSTMSIGKKKDALNIICHCDNINAYKEYYELRKEVNNSKVLVSTNKTTLTTLFKEINLVNKMNYNKYKFILILCSKENESIISMLNDNKEYVANINKIYVLTLNKDEKNKIEKYTDLKPEVRENKPDIITALNQLTDDKLSYVYKVNPIIDTNEYSEKYINYHKAILKFFWDIQDINNKFSYKLIQDFADNIDLSQLIENRDVKTNKENFIRFFSIIDNHKIKNINDAQNESYSPKEEEYIYLFKKWLENDHLALNKLLYYVSGIVNNLNIYSRMLNIQKQQNKKIEGEKIFYRNQPMKISELLQYTNSLVFTSMKFITASKSQSFHTFNIEERKKNFIFSVNFVIHCSNRDIYNPDYIDISYDSKRNIKNKYSNLVIFEPFTFFRVNNTNINYEDFSADIDLEVASRKEIHIKNKLIKNDKNEKRGDEYQMTMSVYGKNNSLLEPFNLTPELFDQIEDQDKQTIISDNYLSVFIKKAESEKNNLNLDKEITNLQILNKEFQLINNKNTSMFVGNRRINFTKEFDALIDGYYKVTLFLGDKIKDAVNMFQGCSNINSIDLSKFKSGNIVNMSNMFANCGKITFINLSGLNTEKVKTMNAMFNNCSSLEKVDLSSFNTKNVTDFGHMFIGCSSLTSVNLTNIITSSAKNLESMFFGCSSLNNINLKNIDLSNVENMKYMFCNCSLLTQISFENLKAKIVKDMSNMFFNCISLSSVNLSGFIAPNVSDVSYLFYSCSKLTSIDLSNIESNNIHNISYMFCDCSNLTKISFFRQPLETFVRVDSIFEHISDKGEFIWNCDMDYTSCLWLKGLPDGWKITSKGLSKSIMSIPRNVKPQEPRLSASYGGGIRK